MRVKNVTVEIRSLKSVLKETADVMKKIRKGEKDKPKFGLSFPDIEDFRKFFTPKRLELLKIIKKTKPNSIYELSKKLNRDIKSVTTDLHILKDYGLLELEKKVNKNNKSYKVKPVFNFDKITMSVEI